MASCKLSRDSCDCRGPKEASDSGRGDDKIIITMDDRNRVVVAMDEEVDRPGLGLGFGSQENDRRYKLYVVKKNKINKSGGSQHPG